MLSRFVPGVLLIVAYAWLFERAGFFLCTLLFMVGWQKIVERESWLKTALIAILCSGAMWALFSFLLKGVLPTGAWFG
jgi:NADH:ubiquinone oxidoreductase subunit H